MLIAGPTASPLARLAGVYGLPVIDASHIGVLAAEFGESYLPAAEPSDDWTARLGTSVRRVFGSWLRG